MRALCGRTAQMIHRSDQVIPLHDLPRPDQTQPLWLRTLRFVTQITRDRDRTAALSWIIWLFCVVGFAFWTLYQYQAPAGVPWVGMTIHTSVFALWLLVAREWLIIQLQRYEHDTEPVSTAHEPANNRKA